MVTLLARSIHLQEHGTADPGAVTATAAHPLVPMVTTMATLAAEQEHPPPPQHPVIGVKHQLAHQDPSHHVQEQPVLGNGGLLIHLRNGLCPMHLGNPPPVPPSINGYGHHPSIRHETATNGHDAGHERGTASGVW